MAKIKELMSNSEKKAIFRYNVIAPLINHLQQNPIKNKALFFKNAQGTHYFEGVPIFVSSSTIKKWYIAYTKHGVDGLRDKIRTRKESSRKISDKISSEIINLLTNTPKITAKKIYESLFTNSFISSSDVSYVTIAREVKKLKLKLKMPKENRLSWEKAKANECWQIDTSKGPIIYHNSKRIKTYIIAIIDDATRLIVGAQLFLADNSSNFQIVLRKALKTYGIPKMLYMDNGSPYKNSYTPQVCAKLAIRQVHTKIYEPESKGKIERLFSTIQKDWIDCKDFSSYTVNQLNDELANVVIRYNTRPHSSLSNKPDSEFKYTPYERYALDREYIRYLTDDIIDAGFIFEVRKMISKTGTFRLNKTTYEVPPVYIGEKVVIRYSIDYSIVQLVGYGNELIDLEKVDKVANASLKRSIEL